MSRKLSSAGAKAASLVAVGELTAEDTEVHAAWLSSCQWMPNAAEKEAHFQDVEAWAKEMASKAPPKLKEDADYLAALARLQGNIPSKVKTVQCAASCARAVCTCQHVRQQNMLKCKHAAEPCDHADKYPSPRFCGCHCLTVMPTAEETCIRQCSRRNCGANARDC